MISRSCALTFALAAAAGAITASRAAGQERPQSAPPEEFAGCWRDAADSGRFLELEPGRMRDLSGAKLEFTRASYDVDTLTRHVWGRREVWELSFEGERLVVQGGRVTRRFERATERPAALDPVPLVLGESTPLPAERRDAIAAEMAKRKERDQAVRTDRHELHAMEEVDADNTRWLIERVQEVGWIDQGRFGKETALGAFLIVQHSGHLPLMLASLPEIEKDVKSNRLDPQNYALLFDRLRIRLGQRQRYGSQLGTDDAGRMVVLALEDRERVEELRKEIGILPLRSYLAFFRNEHASGEVGFEDDEPD